MKRLCLDIEVFPNYFLAVIKDIDTGKFYYIEQFKDEGNVNDITDIIKNSYLITYNGIGYDNIILNYIIIMNPTNEEIYNFSKFIIEQKHKDDYYDIIKIFKHSKLYKPLDLMRMLFSKKLRVSLKSLQIMLKWHNVLECDISFDDYVTKDQLEEIKEYCVNDVESTEYLAEFCKKDIRLRFDIQKEYGIKCLSSDGVKLGLDLMTKFIKDDYIQTNNVSMYRANQWFKSLQPNTNSFKYGEIINDFISFKDPILKDLLEEIKNFKYVHKEKYFSKRILFRGTAYDVGSGGLHSYISKPMVIEPNSNEVYEQRDFSGYYPSQRMLIGRPHNVLKPYYNRQDKIVTTKRAIAKKNKDKVKDSTFKLIGNSLFGNFANEWSNFCDVEYAAFQTIK